jgi:hypothetical protein
MVLSWFGFIRHEGHGDASSCLHAATCDLARVGAVALWFGRNLHAIAYLVAGSRLGRAIVKEC